MAANGNKGKFSERLKKIIFFRRNKNINKEKKNIDEDQLLNKENVLIEDSNKIYINFLKVVAAIPGLVYENIVDNEVKDERNTEKIDYTATHDLKKEKTISPIASEEKRLKVNKIIKPKKEKNVEIDSKKQPIYDKQIKIDNQSRFNETPNANKKHSIGLRTKSEKRKLISDISINDIKKKQEVISKEPVVSDKSVERIKELEKSIINLIKKDLIRIVNEMEILQSELYILSEVNGESIVLKDCQKELDNVKAMICKIDKLKEQYDFLKDNYDFEYLLEINNEDIVDKIIELRDSFGKNEIKAVAEDYKLLEVYQYLYLKIDNLQDKMSTYEENKEIELQKLKERDIDFEQLKKDVYNVDYTNKNYEVFINNQNEILKNIDENVHKINSYEQIDYHLKGFRELFLNSFKYFGLLMVSPLKGIIPSIATETLITGNLIKNLYKNLELEEERRIVYEAIDYSSIISNAINDLDSTSNIVDTTLDDIVHLKMKYNDQFRKYQGNFLEYQDVMHKINDMENKIMGNKIKIEIMKKRALDQQRENNKKLKLVKELNERNNN